MTIFDTNETFYQAMTTDPLSISIYQWKAILQQHRGYCHQVMYSFEHVCRIDSC